MITIKEKALNTLEVNISGIFNHEDIKQLKPVLKKYATNAVDSRLLLVAQNFHGWYGAGPWWSDLTLNDECSCKLIFKRIALVGDQSWEIWLITFASGLAPFNETKFFTHEEFARAKAWLAGSRANRNLLKTLTV